MSAPTSSKAFFWVVCALLAGGVCFSLYAVSQKPYRLGGEPRTDAPFEELTRYFTRQDLPVVSGPLGYDLTYYWFAPQKPWPDSLKFPLVIMLHGAPGKSYAGKYLIQREMQLNFPAFIAAPVLPPGHHWGWPQTARADGRAVVHYRMPDVVTMVRDIVQNYPVDTRRIYVLGCSEGGVGTFAALRNYPEVFAAGAAMSGTWRAEDAKPLAQVPLWVLHGTFDQTYPVQALRDVVQTSRANGGKTLYTEFQDMGHNCPSPRFYTPALWQWLFSQKKG